MKQVPESYIIAYHLHEPDKNYQGVEAQIESLQDRFRFWSRRGS